MIQALRCPGARVGASLIAAMACSAALAVQPAAATPTLNALGIAGGKNVTCAITRPFGSSTNTGGVACWGRNDQAQLGTGLHFDSLSPVAVPGLSSVVQVSVGASHACARLLAGTVKCWGSNSYGNSGNTSVPRTKYAYPAVTVTGLAGIKSIAAGGDHTCARYPLPTKSSGYGVKCWGSNLTGELGNGSSAQYSRTPVVVQGITHATAIASGEGHSCALLDSGTVWCWGNDTFGQLGDQVLPAFGAIRKVTKPVQVIGVAGATAITAGDRFTCALLSNGKIMCWGLNASGQLGDGQVSGAISKVPVEVGKTMMWLPQMRDIAANGAHACALSAADGSLWCWGSNTFGEAGLGTTNEASLPDKPFRLDNGPMQAPLSVGLGASHSCATFVNGVACWGSNTDGELGLGNHDVQTYPRSLPAFG